MMRAGYIFKTGIDMVFEDEAFAHILALPDPLKRPVSDEKGNLVACPCHVLVTWDKNGTRYIWHRKVT